MAIELVDKEPEDEPKTSAPKPAIKPDKGVPNESVEPELPHPAPQAPGTPQGQLPFAKSDPRPRGEEEAVVMIPFASALALFTAQGWFSRAG